jgi:hypothetical protein
VCFILYLLYEFLDKQKTIMAVESKSFNDLFALYHLLVDQRAMTMRNNNQRFGANSSTPQVI